MLVSQREKGAVFAAGHYRPVKLHCSILFGEGKRSMKPLPNARRLGEYCRRASCYWDPGRFAYKHTHDLDKLPDGKKAATRNACIG